ncbi:MAG: M56 family metallopeptidase [Patescibacteria group bacterium]
MLVVGGIGILVVKFSNGIYVAAQLFFGKINSVCGCLSAVTFSTHPWLFSALLFGGLFLLAVLSLAISIVLRLCFRTGKFVRYNLQRQKRHKSDKLLVVSRDLGIADRVIESESEEPIVFCYGYRHPKICVSSALAERLSDSELLAVLLHEKFHLNAREPAKLLVVRIISLLFFFVPGIKLLVGKYITFSELAADEAATVGFTNKIPLAQALHKIIGWEQKSAMGRMFALSFFSSITEERVRKLTDDSYIPSSAWITKKILAGVFCALAFFAGANAFLSSRVIQNSLTSHTHSKTCNLAETEARKLAQIVVCEPKNDSNNCIMTHQNFFQNQC